MIPRAARLATLVGGARQLSRGWGHQEGYASVAVASAGVEASCARDCPWLLEVVVFEIERSNRKRDKDTGGW